MALVDRRPWFGVGARGRTCTATSKDEEFYQLGVQHFIDKHFQPAYDAGYRRFIYWLPAGGFTEVTNAGQCVDEDGDGDVERVGLEKSQSYISSTIDALNWISPGGRGEIPPDSEGYPFTDRDSNFGYSSIPNHVGNSVGPCDPNASPNCYPEGDISPGINPDAINYYNDIISPDGALQRWLDSLNDTTVEFSFYVGYRVIVDQNPLINFIKEGVDIEEMGPLNPRVITPDLTFRKSDGNLEAFRDFVDRNIAPLIAVSRSPVGYSKKIYVDNGSPSGITPRIQDQSDPTGGSRYTLREYASYIKSAYGAEVINEAIPTTGGAFPTTPDYNFMVDGALALYTFLEGQPTNTAFGRDQGTWYFPKEYSNLMCAFSSNGGWLWDFRFTHADERISDGFVGVGEAITQKIDQGYIPGSLAQYAVLGEEGGQGIDNGIALNLMKYLKDELTDNSGNKIEYVDGEGNTRYPYLTLP